MQNLIKKIQNTCFHHRLFEKGDKIVLAVSGGPDSVSMLDIFARLQKKYELDLIIAHMNYGLRGADSDADEEFVCDLAGKYGLEIFAAKVRVPKKSSENILRDIRYEFFEKLRVENNFDFVAIAHNADDQVETYLMRVIRGAGLQGLASMRYKNKRIIRPLLATPRAEIYEYLKENKLSYRTDKTNLETKFFRNKIRNKLLPYLENNFNPGIRQTVFGATESIAEDYALIGELEEKTWGKFKALEISKLLLLHPAMQKRILRRALAGVKNNLKNVDASHIEEILKIAKSTKGKAQVVVLAGLKISRKGDKLNVEKLK